ncbi:MAG: HypC/HybG/HupF family hydrogenase formation chaperone [Phycisphaerales bacterium]|nr:HypC/HybG/HupF family hydrogenase formation chaperone [Phycisphaerales bacterium]
MCLAVPAKIVEIEDKRAIADLNGNRITISLRMLPETAIGDWVLVHAGFAIQKLDAEAARETFSLLAEVENASKTLEKP